MLMPIAASLRLAISRSTSLGREWTSLASLPLCVDHVLGGERLVGEAHVHDGARVALGGGQVDQAALAEHVDARGRRSRTYCSTNCAQLALLDAHRLQRRDVDLDVEVARVGDDAAVLHRLEVLAGR